jgi:xanthosine utilization system XapX-like protein
MLHMLVFSALTKRSPDTKVIAVPMLRGILPGQQIYKPEGRKLCWYPDNFGCQQEQSLRDDSLEHFRSGPKG